MDKILFQDFFINQPTYPRETATDRFYFEFANRLLEKLERKKILADWPESVVRRLALGMSGYYQDIISDLGVWRCFTDANKKLYGQRVPFNPEGEDYILYELNIEDVRFLTWYLLSMNYEEKRGLYPHDSIVESVSDLIFKFMEEEYEDAPEPEDHNIARGLKFHDLEDSEAIYHLGSWLFLHCYLIKPAFALTLGQIMSDPELHKPENITLLHERIEQSMMEDPTGPLALYIPEWVYLLIEGKLPEERDEREERKGDTEINTNDREHPYYTAFVKATGGSVLKYFDDYKEMNRFFIDALGWSADEEHLPQMKHERDFVLMVNKNKGMLLAKNICRCIADPANPYYDSVYASKHAIELLTVRGCCPADLLKHICGNRWLPDAVFEGSTDKRLVADNWDFIARCYLQQYYRGD